MGPLSPETGPISLPAPPRTQKNTDRRCTNSLYRVC